MNTFSHAAYQRLTASKTIVLCVHGIQGSPSQFRWLIESIPSDIDYKCILLPGHGTSIKDFRKTSASEWEEYTNTICREAIEKYEQVIYVGHSMGCLLGINAVVSSSIQFDAMLLMACPIILKPTIKYFINNYRAISGRKTSNPYIDAVSKSNSVQSDSPYQYISCIKPYISLFKLMRRVKKQLSSFHSSVVLIHSENDEIVSEKSLAMFKNTPYAKMIIASKSGHFMYTSIAKSMVIEELNTLIRIGSN